MSMRRKIVGVIGLVGVIPCLVAVYLSISMPDLSILSKSIIISLTLIIGILGAIYLFRFVEFIIKLYEKLSKIADGDLSGKVSLDKSPEAEGIVSSINNVTCKLRKNANELEKRAILIERSADELKRRDTIRSNYLSDIAHELRAPLINIDKSSAFLIEESRNVLSDEQCKFLKIINSNAKRLTHMVNELLDMSRIEAGELIMQYEMADVNGVIEEAVGAVERWLHSKDLKLIKNIDDNLPQIYADKIRLSQVIINLLSNAIKFTTAGGKISITCSKYEEIGRIMGGAKDKDEYIMFSVEDNGEGFSEAVKELIFVRYKLEQELGSYKKMPNTGLGLPIAKQIVELHGGRIWAKSKDSHGSKFSFIIPLGVKSTELNVSLNRPGISQKRILVIDDEQTVRDLLLQEMQKKGYLVDTARDGFEGFKKDMRTEYDLIITDIRMPNMDGVECMNILKKINPDVSVIAVSGFALAEDIKKVLSDNAYMYVRKPFDLPKLLQIVDQKVSEVIVKNEIKKT